jgi:lysophospholipase L1-like esterase
MAAAAVLVSLISFSSASAAQECEREAIAVTTTPIPPQSARAWKRYQETADGVNASPVLVIGDSLSEMWPENDVKKLWPNYGSVNFGVGGDRTQNVLWRLGRPEVSKLKPTQVLLVIGTNNIGSGDSACATAEGVRAILKRFDELWPGINVTILQMPPRGPDFTTKDKERREYNSLLKEIADQRPGTETLNVDKAITCNQYSETPPSAIENWVIYLLGRGTVCDSYQPDDLHFTEAGYRRIVDEVGARK